MKDCRKLGGHKAPKGMIEEVSRGTNWAVVFTMLGLALFWAVLMLILL